VGTADAAQLALEPSEFLFGPARRRQRAWREYEPPRV
jgi:hypothetical protein